MSFQINALDYSAFRPFFSMPEAELQNRNIIRMAATSNPGFPCRVSLQDAQVGETVVLLNYTHLELDSPFHSCHAIYVREAATKADLAQREIPASLSSRLLSARAFNNEGMMLDADVVDGKQINHLIDRLFDNSQVDFIQLHNAKLGCFAANVSRSEH